jgi:hypothetical protein
MTLAPTDATVREGSSDMRHSSMPAVLVATIPASFLFTTVWTELRGGGVRRWRRAVRKRRRRAAAGGARDGGVQGRVDGRGGRGCAPAACAVSGGGLGLGRGRGESLCLPAMTEATSCSKPSTCALKEYGFRVLFSVWFIVRGEWAAPDGDAQRRGPAARDDRVRLYLAATGFRFDS